MCGRRFVRDDDPFYDETFRHADTEAAYRVLMQSDFGFVHQAHVYSRAAQQRGRPFRPSRSFLPERVRRLIRHGLLVLPEDDYRHELRGQLREYVWMLLKQRVKPSRWRDEEFRAFARGAIERITAESDDDPDVRRALGFARPLVR